MKFSLRKVCDRQEQPWKKLQTKLLFAKEMKK